VPVDHLGDGTVHHLAEARRPSSRRRRRGCRRHGWPTSATMRIRSTPWVVHSAASRPARTECAATPPVRSAVASTALAESHDPHLAMHVAQLPVQSISDQQPNRVGAAVNCCDSGSYGAAPPHRFALHRRRRVMSATPRRQDSGPSEGSDGKNRQRLVANGLTPGPWQARMRDPPRAGT